MLSLSLSSNENENNTKKECILVVAIFDVHWWDTKNEFQYVVDVHFS